KIAFGTFCVVFFITLIIRVLPTISPSPATPAIQPHTQMQTIQPAPFDTVWNVYDRESWNTALAAIRNSSNNSNHFINVTGNFSVPGKTTFSFDTVAGLTVTISGSNTISLSSAGILLVINTHQTVIIKDLTLQGYSNNNRALVHIEGTLTMQGSATISGNTIKDVGGGGVFVRGGGNFIMENNSRVTGNTAARSGGGVLVTDDSFFTMRDNASISGNTSSQNGGGVWVNNGTIIIEDNASIHGNTARYRGGGVGVWGSESTFTKSGGTIYGNIAARNFRNISTRSRIGHAVYQGNPSRQRNATAGPSMNTDNYWFWRNWRGWVPISTILFVSIFIFAYCYFKRLKLNRKIYLSLEVIVLGVATGTAFGGIYFMILLIPFWLLPLTMFPLYILLPILLNRLSKFLEAKHLFNPGKALSSGRLYLVLTTSAYVLLFLLFKFITPFFFW
ncbi:MAG: right-handed parallel beta-helix repeat-containing protein, partial [Spirochaetes bacterium]|nr:right-handed parallel beta-helix repeat-containing protein [Spirochaetota bacterium]